jgi:hypothetical protein
MRGHNTGEVAAPDGQGSALCNSISQTITQESNDRKYKIALLSEHCLSVGCEH